MESSRDPSAYLLGHHARQDGRPIGDCPYRSPWDADLWRFGWHDADVGALWDGPESASFGASRSTELDKSRKPAIGAASRGTVKALQNGATD